MQHSYRLVSSCPDKIGIVARVSEFVADHGGWLIEANYHSEPGENRFFMRNEIRAESLSVGIDSFCQQFSLLANEYDMRWYIQDSLQKKKVVVMASKASHCLADILHRWHSGDLFCDIAAVISNHRDVEQMVKWHDVPFHCVPMTPENKQDGNVKIAELLKGYDTDVVVLARYMQIMPADICQQFMGKIINIHHSFLPSFIGANPYQKAFERGVKLIGATSHYVTENLDEGPIIEQDVVRVNHRHTKDDMRRLGKDIETLVLSRALRNHLEDRVIVHGNKTVVFE